jgi:hypothetical protein
MNTFARYATAAALVGALAVPMATPSMAAHGRNAAAAIGFGAGALIGAAAANTFAPHYGYYEPGYAYAPDYAYGPDYAYEPGPAVDAYAYAPAPRRFGGVGEWNQHACQTSPASLHHEACLNH